MITLGGFSSNAEKKNKYQQTESRIYIAQECLDIGSIG